MCLLLGIQLAGPALHAVAFYAHHSDAAHHQRGDHHEHPAGDCEVCQFVAGLTPELPRPAPLVELAPTVDCFIARQADAPRSVHLTASSARAPPALF